MSDTNQKPDLREVNCRRQKDRRDRLKNIGCKPVIVFLRPEHLAFLDSVPRQGINRGSRPVAIENLLDVAIQAVEKGLIKMEELTITKY